MTRRSIRHLDANAAGAGKPTRPESAPSDVGGSSKQARQKPAKRYRRVLLNRAETVADQGSIEDEGPRGARQQAIEPEALADLTFPPATPAPPPRVRSSQKAPKQLFSGENIEIRIPLAKNKAPSQKSRLHLRQLHKRGNVEEEDEDRTGEDGPLEARLPQGHKRLRVLAAKAKDSRAGDSDAIRRSSLQRPTPREPRPSQLAADASYDFLGEDGQGERHSVEKATEDREEEEEEQQQQQQQQQEEDGGIGPEREPASEHQAEDHAEYQDEQEASSSHDLDEQDSQTAGSNDGDETDSSQADGQFFKLPFWPIEPQEQHQVKVYCGALQKAYLDMGKEAWAGGGEGWRKHWNISVAHETTVQLAKELLKLTDLFKAIPAHPEIGMQDKYLREEATRLQRVMSKIQQSVGQLCNSLSRSRRGRSMNLSQEVTISIVPAAVVLLRLIFMKGGMAEARVATGRYCAYMSPTTVAMAEYIGEWIKELTSAVVRLAPHSQDAGFKGLRAQVQREALIDHMVSLRDARGGLAEAEAKFVDIVDAEMAEQQCREAEAAVRREAAVADEAIRRTRQLESQARYVTEEDQYQAFCRSTQNLGPDPLLEHRRRRMEASMRAFASSAPQPRGVSIEPVQVAPPPPPPPQPPPPPSTTTTTATTCIRPQEPSDAEKRLILEHVVTSRDFDVDGVAGELGWTTAEVGRWRDILVKRAKKAYAARGYSAEQLPEWLLN